MGRLDCLDCKMLPHEAFANSTLSLAIKAKSIIIKFAWSSAAALPTAKRFNRGNKRKALTWFEGRWRTFEFEINAAGSLQLRGWARFLEFGEASGSTLNQGASHHLLCVRCEGATYWVDMFHLSMNSPHSMSPPLLHLELSPPPLVY